LAQAIQQCALARLDPGGAGSAFDRIYGRQPLHSSAALRPDDVRTSRHRRRRGFGLGDAAQPALDAARRGVSWFCRPDRVKIADWLGRSGWVRARSLLPPPRRMLIFPGIIDASGPVGAVEWLARPLKPAFPEGPDERH